MGFLGFRTGKELQRRAQHERGEQVRMDRVNSSIYPCGSGCAESNDRYSTFACICIDSWDSPSECFDERELEKIPPSTK